MRDGSSTRSTPIETSRFQLFIAGPGGKLAADRRTRLPGGRRDAGVSGQVRGIGEVLAIADGQHDVRGGRDSYAGHRHQDLGKRKTIRTSPRLAQRSCRAVLEAL